MELGKFFNIYSTTEQAMALGITVSAVSHWFRRGIIPDHWVQCIQNTDKEVFDEKIKTAKRTPLNSATAELEKNKEHQTIEEQIPSDRVERVAKMSEHLKNLKTIQTRLSFALTDFQQAQTIVNILDHYYFQGAWIQDFEADEQGKIPKYINRGALSEDDIYNTINKNQEILNNMKEVIAKLEKMNKPE